MLKKYIEAKIIRTKDKIEFVATDETIDRYGDSLKMEDWDLKEFKKNPVLLVNHDYRVENIVGKVRNLKRDKEKKRLTFEPLFHDITELAKGVKKMVEDKFLNTVSVGFIPHSDEKKKSITLELLEISFVPIPANPGAHQLMVKEIDRMNDKGLDDKKIGEIKDFIIDKNKILPKEKKTQVSRSKANSRAVSKVKDLDLRMTQSIAKYTNALLYKAKLKNKKN